MTTYTKISDLDVTSSLTDNDKFIVETATGTKACTRSALREETQITPEDIGLGNVDNTHDLDKPISNAMASALLGKVDTSTFNTTLQDFLTKVDAATTYLTQNNASGTYLSKTDASNYYLTQADADTIYITKTEASSLLPSATAETLYLSKTDASSMYATKTEALENVTTNTYTVLTTTTQTVLGAINEVNGLLAGVEQLLSEV